jgi:hypothetical protein
VRDASNVAYSQMGLDVVDEKVVKDTQHAGGPRVKKGKHVPAYEMISHDHSQFASQVLVQREPIRLGPSVGDKELRFTDICVDVTIYEY